MSCLTLARVLFVILALQLAVGLQPGIATAATTQGVHSSADACPTHSQSANDQSANDQAAALKHDCCKSSGCQSQCGNLPLAVHVSIARTAVDESALAGPAYATRAPSAPSDTHFRPPIAL